HSESRTCPTILVGNKNDLVRSRLVSADDGKLIATLYDAKYIETSAVLKHQVDELLVGILTHLKQRTGDGERKLKRGTSAKKFFRRILSFDCSEPSDCEITYG
ncbi:GTP-binding protein RAD-like, partial [Lingula anatina]|uniref:GTP-binding protein RAD-like n=1 Tax=Lingula anatina TaxID=7574 RepID=A0A1S3JPI8_LINAN